MKRTNSRTIQIPVKKENTQDADELNLRSYDYARRTAIPTLDDYILTPFSEAFKERAFVMAVKNVGLDDDELLIGSHTLEEELNGMKFRATSLVSHRTANENVLFQFRDYLKTIIAENQEGKARQGVQKADGAAFVHVQHIFDEYIRLLFDEENRTPFNQTSFMVIDPATGKKPVLDEPRVMPVSLDLKRYRGFVPDNARAYLAAESLKDAQKNYITEYEQAAKMRFAISAEGLTESQEFDFDLSDGSGARFLFYPKKSIAYEKILSGTIGAIVKDTNGNDTVGMTTKGIAGSTGDLFIVKELAFKDTFDYSRGGSGVRVATNARGKKRGQLLITRFFKEGDSEERSYELLRDEGRLYVHAEDILSSLDTWQDRHTTVPTQFKIDIFSAPPEYLR